MPKLVYLVEDDDHIAQILQHFLKAGYEPVHCPNVMEAGRKLRAKLPDMIVMDLGLPDLSGAQFLKMLRANDKYKHIPVLILTGQAPDQAEKAFRESGAQALMYKPFTKVSLLEQVGKILPPEGAAGAPAAAVPAAPPAPAPPPPTA